jgi:hypothetical protein
MELVILSTFATVAILIAELGGLAHREHLGRSTATTGALRLASVADLAAGSPAANQESVARTELDRAA